MEDQPNPQGQSSQRESRTGGALNKSCPLCSEPDNEEMVACDVCDIWFHFSCTGTTADIANEDWSCQKCITDKSRAADEERQQKVKADNLSKRKTIQLQLLEEEMTLMAKRDAEYLRRKFELLMDESNESKDVCNNNEHQNSSIATPDVQPKSVAIPAENPVAVYSPYNENQALKTTDLQSELGNAIPMQSNNNYAATSRYLPSSAIGPVPVPAKVVYNHQQVTTNIQTDNDLRAEQNEDILGLPTSRQLATRHSLSRELPIFSGTPDEWPLFISSFEGSTRLCGFNNQENLMRLQRCLKGRAMEAVRSRMLLPSNVPRIIQTLRMLYGRPEMIIHSLMVKVRNEPAPHPDKLHTLITYALAIENLCATMEASGLEDHLANPVLLQEIVEKLPVKFKVDWVLHRRSLPIVNLSSFSNWLFELAEMISDVALTPSYCLENRGDRRSTRGSGRINTHAEGAEATHNNNSKGNTRKCKVCNQECSQIGSCVKFANMSLNEKWETVKRLRLCRTCLVSHFNSRCRSSKICGINGCTRRHHSMLHKISDDALQSPHTTAPVLFNCNQHRSAHQSVLFRIIPVVLYGINRKVNTFAFLDEGSSLTLMDNSLADELNLTGPKEQLCLKWTGQTHRVENNSKIVSADISASNNGIKYALRNIRTVKSLNLPEQSLHLNELKQKHPHLRSIPIQSYEHAVPRILIGLDNWKLSFPLKAREGQEKEPAAMKTRLGWVVFGGNDQTPKDFRHYHICECERNNESLHNMMKEYFSLDSLGVSTQVTVRSAEEERAIQMLESQTIRKGDRFQTPLLWKYDDIQLPNSYPMATRRYECLRKKLSKDSTLADNINLQIKTYLEKGYIRKLSDVDLRKEYSRVWYLPIFTVININKPGKLRIVWDAAAKVEGISLNSMLSKGPDQLSSLLSVLFKFRERRIGICGDIREMFHQVLVCEDDQHVQRFLWSEDGFDRKPDVYVMQVLTFGATCSPSCAQFAKNKNAQEFEQKFPRAVKSILENHYVDDLLDSVDTETEAIQLAKEIRDIHSKCGFEIRNWVSNSPKVIEELGGKQRDSKIINVNPEVESTERVLGMYWCTSSDSFTFILSPKSSLQDIINTDTRPTKRKVLRVMMTIFDPLGLIAHFIVYIKILMQDIWRASLDWDDPILDEHYRNWCNWVSLLKNIHNIRIPRCYLKNIQFGDQEDLQLHVFVDASENAFAAVAFLRVSKGIEVECSIVTSKTRVAPLKMASIPRLELEAARLGARLAKTILKAHNIIVSKQFFWSDSRTVLSWIKSDHRKYRQFVAFRVSEILDMTDMNQWRYVPSKENVADDATKWSGTPDFGSSSRWFNGPPFLKQDEDKWPRIISNELTTEDLRAHVLYHTKVQQNIFQVERFSSWWKLIRVVALVYRFLWNSLWAKKRCAAKRTGFIEKCEYLKAENCLFRQAQSSYYCDEISIFQNNKCLPIGSKVCLDKSSPLYKMSPYLDEEGVLRSHGRIDAAIGISSSVKRPILLPKDHYITRLIVNSYHLRFHHQNNETVVNELRQRFVIPRLRVVVRIIKRDCQACKNQRAKPRPPEMAQLPLARLASFTRPFTFVGLDYFGPITVTMGRRTEKRWGVLLTCLTTRAIHIEVAGSLSSDSCILAIKRFIARRGVPNEIRCDNGTNFHGAERELREVTEKQNKQLADEFSSSVTKWIFNPPAAPHMGGSWERLVQSVKKTLKQIMPTRNPNDELLYSMLVETERTINTRPLTYLPLDSEGDEALTPNHFLLGSSNGEKPDGILCDGNILMKRNWTNAQKFANSFWKRWVREYLPDLTHRTKWYNQVKPIEKGDVVIIVDENNPRNTWPKGRILQTTTGKDGQVRKAVVQTSTGIYIRPAVKLAVLDVFKNSKSDDITDIPGGSVGNDATTDIENI